MLNNRRTLATQLSDNLTGENPVQGGWEFCQQNQIVPRRYKTSAKSLILLLTVVDNVCFYNMNRG